MSSDFYHSGELIGISWWVENPCSPKAWLCQYGGGCGQSGGRSSKSKGPSPLCCCQTLELAFSFGKDPEFVGVCDYFPEPPTLHAWKGLGRNWFVEHCGFSFPLEPFFLGSIVYRSYARWSPVQGEAITGDEHFSWLLLQGGSGKEPLKSSVTRNFIKKNL